MRISMRWVCALVAICVLVSCSKKQTREQQAPAEQAPPTQEASAEETEEAPEQAKADGALETFEGADGAYTMPIPRNWEATQKDAYALLVSPEYSLRVYALTTTEADLDKAIASAWDTVAPDLNFEVERTFDPPPPEGVEEVRAIHYKPIDQRQLAQALAKRHDGKTYVLMFEGDISAIQKRGSQLNVVFSGHQITALEQTSLADASPSLGDEKLAELDDHIQKVLKFYDIPGVSVGVVHDGEVVWKKAYGVRRKGAEQKMTPQTRMMIGSTTKTMTTMLMAAAVDDDAMTWQTPAQRILPRFSVKDEEISRKLTMENTVCACTGVPRRDFEILFNFESMTPESLVESLETFEFFTDFGEAFQYSNQMVAAGGYLTALALGGEWGKLQASYRKAMDEKIFGPIGMDATTTDFEEVTSSDRYAAPHGMTMDGVFEPISLDIERFVLPLAPAGAGWSTTEDMTKYLLVQLNKGTTPDGTQVVSEENLTHTWEPQIEVSADVDYGLGWLISDWKDIRVVSHNGNTMGFTSELAFMPEKDLGVTILTNGRSTNGFADSVRTRLFELAFEQPNKSFEAAEYAFKTRMEGLERTQKRLDDVDATTVQAWTGTYTSDELGEIVLAYDEAKDEFSVDAGEFSSRLRMMEKDGEVYYVTTDPPVSGSTFQLVEKDGEKHVKTGMGELEYYFKKE
ncbi:MAG: serine hydrolase domain-containing protein [Myxococcota bacterium]